MHKLITLYFSIKGQTIGPGMKIIHQEKGNCHIVAEYIQKALHTDLFEIETNRTYPKNHMQLIEEAKQELNEQIRVSVKQYPEHFEQYETIFLVYPNWWNTIPMVIATFLNHYDWTGKVIIPVCTNEGSGLGNSISDIQKYAKNAQIKHEISFIGSQVKNQEANIIEWAKSVG